MASQWGKFLAPITLASAWSFVFADGGGSHTVTVAAGTYATPLHLGLALQTAIRAIAGGAHAADTVAVSSTGYTTITIAGLASVTWASCTAALKTYFGFVGTETVSSSAVVSTYATTHGWFPGVITRGVSLGEGLIGDTGWEADDVAAVAQSGAGATHITAPARLPYRRTLLFGCIGKTELFDGTRGVRPLRDRRRTSEWYWYPDRDDGTVASYGTQGDPGYNNWEDDDDCDYYIVSILTPPVATQLSRPDLFSVSLTLSCKKK